MMDIQCGDFDNGSLKSDDKFSQRKSKKPLMEKRRRARINNCLLQLKSLVLQAMKKDTSHYSKLEKADILEMTVKHLRTLQRRHISSAVAADPTVAAKYNVGFSECANEVVRYLGNAQGINEDVRNRILNHLGGCMQSLNTPQMSSSMTPHHQLQPIHVQIPTPQTTDHASLFSSDRLLVQSTPSQQTPVVNVPLQKPMQSSGNHLSGGFELVHGSAFNGQVAFFLGQSCDTPNMYSIQSQTKPSTSPQNSVPLHCQQNRGSPVYLQHSETSGHYTPVSHKSHVSNVVPGYSPVLCALKEEKLWRPW